MISGRVLYSIILYIRHNNIHLITKVVTPNSQISQWAPVQFPTGINYVKACQIYFNSKLNKIMFLWLWWQIMVTAATRVKNITHYNSTRLQSEQPGTGILKNHTFIYLHNFTHNTTVYLSNRITVGTRNLFVTTSIK